MNWDKAIERMAERSDVKKFEARYIQTAALCSIAKSLENKHEEVRLNVSHDRATRLLDLTAPKVNSPEYLKAQEGIKVLLIAFDIIEVGSQPQTKESNHEPVIMLRQSLKKKIEYNRPKWEKYQK